MKKFFNGKQDYTELGSIRVMNIKLKAISILLGGLVLNSEASPITYSELTQLDVLGLKFQELSKSGYDLSPSYLYTAALATSTYAENGMFQNCQKEGFYICRSVSDSSSVEEENYFFRMGEYLTQELIDSTKRIYVQYRPITRLNGEIYLLSATNQGVSSVLDDVPQQVFVSYDELYKIPTSLKDYGFDMRIDLSDLDSLGSDINSGFVKVVYRLNWASKDIEALSIETVNFNNIRTERTKSVIDDTPYSAVKSEHLSLVRSIPLRLDNNNRRTDKTIFIRVENLLNNGELMEALMAINDIPLTIQVRNIHQFQNLVYTVVDESSRALLARQTDPIVLVDNELFREIRKVSLHLTIRPESYDELVHAGKVIESYNQLQSLPLINIIDIQAGDTIFSPQTSRQEFILVQQWDGRRRRMNLALLNMLDAEKQIEIDNDFSFSGKYMFTKGVSDD
ncbi:hypothetical protein [Vibrio sp. R78045]|uniref:hypothetical protein n=1 Tax=Vibrio sp. R78045 TaxID=3093868 RepID=UPI0036F1BDE5